MGVHQAERGVALLRIFSGILLLRTAFSHLYWSPWPWVSSNWVRITADQLAGHSLDHPTLWLRYFIQQFLLPQVDLYAGITNDLTLLAGISLTFGLLTLVGAVIGFGLAVFHVILLSYTGNLAAGYYLTQVVLMVVIFFTRSGRKWGFDAILAGRNTKGFLL